MSRYSQKGDEERRAMLDTLGAASIDDLLSSIPEELRLRQLLELPAAHSEDRLLKVMSEWAATNRESESAISFLGAGMYDHFVPSAVRSVAGRSEFATAYTPYQPELSQGTLQTIFEFQTLMCELTGLDVANASLYDGGSAVAEAIALACGAKRRQRVLLLPGIHPNYLEVLRTYSTATGIELEILESEDGRTPSTMVAEVMRDDVACVVAQQPNIFGLLEDMEEIGETAHAAGALFIAVVDPVSLGLLAPPGEYGADIAVGEGQALGNVQTFGGPGYGFFAGRAAHVRRFPGRLVGESVDTQGRRAFVLTLQTREQHIRRERATSNICTNQGLMATAATIYMSLLGPQGIRDIAHQCAQRAHYACERMVEAGAERLHSGPFFREFAVRTPASAQTFVAEGLKQNMLAGVPLARLSPSFEEGLLVAVTERRSREDIERLAALVRSVRATSALQEA